METGRRLNGDDLETLEDLPETAPRPAIDKPETPQRLPGDPPETHRRFQVYSPERQIAFL